MIYPKTTAQRNAEARAVLHQWPLRDDAIDAFERASIDEAVAVLRSVLDGMNVCHVCGDVLHEPEAGAIIAYGRCVSHGSAEDDEDGEPWHIPPNEWKRRLEAAKLLTEMVVT